MEKVVTIVIAIGGSTARCFNWWHCELTSYWNQMVLLEGKDSSGQNNFERKTSLPYRPMRVKPTPRPWAQRRTSLEKLNELDLSLDGVYGSLRVDLDEYLMTLRRQHDPYTDLEFEKRDGTSRYISVPHEPLLGIQDALHKQYLSEPKLFHDSAYAYIKGRSAVQCARKHEDAGWLIKIDIDNFFHTIDERMVYREFRRRGVTKFNSFVLARFLTREPSKFKGSLPSKYRRHQKNPASKLFDVESRKIGFLPQGSPTSGAISNLVFFDLDNQFEELAHQRGLSYSRYSDDLIFSSPDKFERRNATQTLQTVIRTLRRKSFEPHLGKTKIVPPGARKQVLGVLVGSPGLRLPRVRKSRLDRELWAVRTHGFSKHARHMREPNEFKVLNRLYGTLIWANEIDPSWSRPRIEALREAAESQLGEISRASSVEKA